MYPWVDILSGEDDLTWFDEPHSDTEDDMGVEYLLPLIAKTDRLSGKMLLEASDLQRKSRRNAIKVYWLRELLKTQNLILTNLPRLMLNC